MAKTAILAILGIGIAGAAIMLSKKPKYEVPEPTGYKLATESQTTSTVQNTENNTTEIPVFLSTTQGTVLNPEVPLTTDIIGALNNIFETDIEGSQISNIIHGGSIENTICGYRGTNGKCYSSYEEAKRNGAAYKQWILSQIKDPTNLGLKTIKMNFDFMIKTEPNRLKNEITYTLNKIKKDKPKINADSYNFVLEFYKNRF